MLGVLMVSLSWTPEPWQEKASINSQKPMEHKQTLCFGKIGLTESGKYYYILLS